MITLGLLIEMLGIPPNASEGGYVIDSMLELCHWFMLVLFVGWGGFYFYTLYRFRHSANPKADYYGVRSHLPTKLEGGILVLEVVLLMAFAAPIWAERVDRVPTGPDVIHIRCWGQQYAWNIQYAGKDGKFGERDNSFITPSNPLGVNLKDPNADDDLLTIFEMHVPVNRDVVVEVGSRDVVHDFCVPSFRVAQDAVPGSEIPVWFKATREGTYEIVCAQLCGQGHSAMKGTIVVESQEKYDKWYKATKEATR